MPLQAIYKVPDGKLLKIFLEKEADTIQDIKITGDFFLHPEEKISALEDAIRGLKLDENTLRQKLKATVQNEGIELFGVDVESIVTAIFMAK